MRALPRAQSRRPYQDGLCGLGAQHALLRELSLPMRNSGDIDTVGLGPRNGVMGAVTAQLHRALGASMMETLLRRIRDDAARTCPRQMAQSLLKHFQWPSVERERRPGT